MTTEMTYIASILILLELTDPFVGLTREIFDIIRQAKLDKIEICM